MSAERPFPPRGAAVRTVLHVLPDLRAGGGQTVVLRIIRNQDPQCWRSLVVGLDPGRDDLADPLRAAGAEVVSLGGGDFRTVFGLRDLIRRHRVDLVHTHSDRDRRLGQLAALLTRTPVVGHLHSEWVHLAPPPDRRRSVPRRARAWAVRGFHVRVERMTVRHYLATSRRVKELFLAYVRVPITVLPPAISTEEYDHARRSMDRAGVRRAFGAGGEGVCLTVTVSRLTEGKGHDDLWPMLTALPVDGVDVRLLLVGEGDLRADLQWRADASGVGSRVVFAGTRGDVPEVLAAADLSVFPSHSEGLGLGVLEAMAAGLPVLAYDLPAYREFVEPGRSAVLVPTGDVPELSAAFSALVRDPQRAAELGRTARALVEQRYPIEGLASAVAQAYRLALGVTESA